VGIKITLDCSSRTFWTRIEVQQFEFISLYLLTVDLQVELRSKLRIYLSQFDLTNVLVDAMYTLGDNCEETVGITDLHLKHELVIATMQS